MSFATPIPGLPPLPRSKLDNSALRLPSSGFGRIPVSDPMPPMGRVGLRVTRDSEVVLDDPHGVLVVRDPVGQQQRLVCSIPSDNPLPPGEYVFWLAADDREWNRIVQVPHTPFSSPAGLDKVTEIRPAPSPEGTDMATQEELEAMAATKLTTSQLGAALDALISEDGTLTLPSGRTLIVNDP